MQSLKICLTQVHTNLTITNNSASPKRRRQETKEEACTKIINAETNMIDEEDVTVNINFKNIFWLYDQNVQKRQATKDRIVIDIANTEAEKKLAYEIERGVEYLISQLQSFLRISWSLGN